MEQPTTHAPTTPRPEREPAGAARWIKVLQIAIPLALVGGIALAYLTIGGVHAEVTHAFRVLRSGSTHDIRAYILSFGAWAPAVSWLLMVLQGVAAPIPGFLIVLANGLAFGVV